MPNPTIASGNSSRIASKCEIVASLAALFIVTELFFNSINTLLSFLYKSTLLFLIFGSVEFEHLSHPSAYAINSSCSSPILLLRLLSTSLKILLFFQSSSVCSLNVISNVFFIVSIFVQHLSCSYIGIILSFKNFSKTVSNAIYIIFLSFIVYFLPILDIIFSILFLSDADKYILFKHLIICLPT